MLVEKKNEILYVSSHFQEIKPTSQPTGKIPGPANPYSFETADGIVRMSKNLHHWAPNSLTDSNILKLVSSDH